MTWHTQALFHSVPEVVIAIHPGIELTVLGQDQHQDEIPPAKALGHGLFVGRGRPIHAGWMRMGPGR